MLKAFSSITYITAFIPVWILRRVLGVSRFERAYHKGETTWDLPVGKDGSGE